jgi:hypothetical protein
MYISYFILHTPCVPRVTGGIPGMIHLSQATRDALTSSYQLTEGNGGSRDQYLADNNIHTFLIGTGPTASHVGYSDFDNLIGFQQKDAK